MESNSSGTVDSGTNLGGLQEVVVTAERREEDINKVPISITALQQSTLDDLHLETFSDLATIVPGLTISPTGAGSQSFSTITIRGVTSSNNYPTTGVYIDETPIITRQFSAIGFSGGPQPDLFDLDRLEVLRGPQGTLFGAGAMGGAIRFITPQPNLTTSSGYTRADVSYTEAGAPSFDVGLAFGAPITSGTSAFRVSGWYRSTGGFIDIEDPFTGQVLDRNANASHTLVLRPAFSIAPIDGLTITPAVFFQRHDSDEPNEIWFNQLPNPVSSAFGTGFGAHLHQPDHDSLTVSSLAIKYDFSSLMLQSDTSYTDRYMQDYDDYSNILPALFGGNAITPALSNFYAYDENIASTRAWQQEFRLSSGTADSKVSWVLGLYYRRAVDQLVQYVGPDLSPLTELLYSGQTSEEVFGVPDYFANGLAYNSYDYASEVTTERAVFGDLTVEIVPRLKASAGVRLSYSDMEHQQQAVAGPLNGGAFSFLLPNDREHPITPKFSLTYQFTDNDMVYATGAKGYRTGGSNSPQATSNSQCETSAESLGLTSVPLTFGSDHLWSYEIGTKDAFLNKRLALQASAFYIDWSDIQTNVGLNSCNTYYTANRGKAISQGFDFQMAAIVVDGLKLSADVGYTDSYFPNAEYGSVAQLGATPPLLVGAGDKLAQVLPWTAAGVVDYSIAADPIWNGARSYVRIDYRWLSGTPKADTLVAGYNPLDGGIPDQSYGLLNLRLGLTHGALDVSLFVNNATNANPRLHEEANSSVPVTPQTLFTGVALPPRTEGLTLLYRF